MTRQTTFLILMALFALQMMAGCEACDETTVDTTELDQLHMDIDYFHDSKGGHFHLLCKAGYEGDESQKLECDEKDLSWLYQDLTACTCIPGTVCVDPSLELDKPYCCRGFNPLAGHADLDADFTTMVNTAFLSSDADIAAPENTVRLSAIMGTYGAPMVVNGSTCVKVGCDCCHDLNVRAEVAEGATLPDVFDGAEEGVDVGSLAKNPELFMCCGEVDEGGPAKRCQLPTGEHSLVSWDFGVMSGEAADPPADMSVWGYCTPRDSC
eukprot:485538_1